MESFENDSKQSIAPSENGNPGDDSKGVFPALRHRNFRLFWGGQIISLVGTHAQTVALGWLSLKLTNSAFYLGLLNTMATLPILLFSLFAGIFADRMNKRRLLLATQCAFLVQALVLAVLVSTGVATIWTLLVLAAVQGLIQSFDSPIRQSFVSEMVPPRNVLGAVALNSAVFNGARIIGPAAAGFMIPVVGEAGCFYINAVSFIAVIAGIAMMRESELFRPAREKSETTPLKELIEGFKYVKSERRISGLLGVLIVTSLLGLPPMILLPVFAKDVLHCGSRGMGILFAGAGAGAFLAAFSIAVAKKMKRPGRTIVAMGVIFSISIILFSFSRSFYLSMLLIAFGGAAITASIALTNSSLQMTTPARLRGRIMGIYIFVFLGMMPFGSFIFGTAAHYIGAPHTVAIGGAACIATLLLVCAVFPGVLRIEAPGAESER